MKVYELLNNLAEEIAGKEVKINVNLSVETLKELLKEATTNGCDSNGVVLDRISEIESYENDFIINVGE